MTPKGRMPKALWRTTVDGEAFRALIVRGGRIFVSTDRGTSALGRDGSMLWYVPGALLKSVRDDGRLIAVESTRELVVLDANGRTIRRKPVPGAFGVVGWTSNGEPVIAVEGGRSENRARWLPLGCVWVEPFGYVLTEGSLWRFDIQGVLQSRVPIPFDSFRDQMPRGEGVYDEVVLAPALQRAFDLTPDERHERLIAARWSSPPVVMSIDFEGSVQWLRTLGRDCCNFVCLPLRDDTVCHLSSCGGRLTCLDSDGRVLAARDFEVPPVRIFRSDLEIGIVFINGSVRGFDVRCTERWTCDVPGASWGNPPN
jgi:hypothetical protein